MKRLFWAIAFITSTFFSSLCQAQTITWTTFNIRYDNPADSLNNWQFRKDTVTRFIQAQDMDIVGMQEVLHNQLEDLLQRLATMGKPKANMPLSCIKKNGLKCWIATRSGFRNTPIA